MFRDVIDAVGIGIDLIGVAVIVAGGALAFIGFARTLSSEVGGNAYRRLRQDIGRAILLGLEILVAADIIRTVAIEPTFDSVVVLGGIVLIRTFLSFSLEVELEGRWPWQGRRDASARRASGGEHPDGISAA